MKPSARAISTIVRKQRTGPGTLVAFSTILTVLPVLSELSAQSLRDNYARPAARDWPMVGGDWSNTRYSTLTQIDSQSVKRLGAAWVSGRFDEGGTSRTSPVVKNGRMFLTAGRYVYALNARTGEILWSYNTIPDVRAEDFASSPAEKVMELINSPRGVPNGKGVGVGAGFVFVGLKDGRVIALSQNSGQLAWARQTGIDHPKKGQWAAVAPTYMDNRVFTGLSDGDHNHRGRATALEARTGKLIWQMFAVPSPGEPGHETWPSFNDAWKFGGGGVWTNPPVDRELGLAYLTVGNAVPAYGGDWRQGDNLYTCSVLAVDIRTGKLRWYYQLLRHDVYEADLGVPIVLYDTLVDGEVRKGLAVMRADGYLFNLDRMTGAPLLPVEERAVPQLASQRTAATQPFPVQGESVLMSCDDWRQEKIPAGFVLGCMWTPPSSPPPSSDPPNVLSPFPAAKGGLMAYSPQTGYFYAHSRSFLYWPRRSQDPYFLNWVGAVPDRRVYGQLSAIDGRTGRIAWKKAVADTLTAGGPLATAGGLIFRSSGTGALEAYDARTGEVLWQFETGMGGENGPAGSYEIDGQQYIAFSAGPAVWAFKLGGRAVAAASVLTTVAAPVTETSQPTQVALSGPLVDTDEIETASLHRSLVEPGTRYFIDEYTFNPYRARVEAGTKVLFVNNGLMQHEVVDVSGSWNSGPLSPTQEAWITFDKPGRYTYICREHPWSYGEIEVVARAPDAKNARAQAARPDVESGRLAQQILRGKEYFDMSCAACHGEDLAGRGTAPALSGRHFGSRWRNAAVADLFDNVRTTMPQADPGGLDRQTYLDIVAYLLQANGLSFGPGELKDDVELLRGKTIVGGSQ